MNPDSLPFRLDSDRRDRGSKEDYLSEVEMLENAHHTDMLKIMAFDEFDF